MAKSRKLRYNRSLSVKTVSAKYIFYNGSKGKADDGTGTSHDVAILTGSLSGTDDGINVKETSTRTGYYMKKRLRMDVNCNPSSNMKSLITYHV